MRRAPHIVFFVSEDWYFYSHRLPIARAARDAGFRVSVITQVADHGDRIEAEGFELIPIHLSRSGIDPIKELAVVQKLVSLYRGLRPDVVHQVAMKPVVYGSIAAKIARVPAVVNALAGLGFVFSSDSPKARLLRPALRACFRQLFARKNSILILQNHDDAAMFCESGLARPERIRVIRGSGVDSRRFARLDPPTGVPLVVLPARLLRDKGVYEFVSAARLLRARGVDARFALVGSPDRGNPASVAESTLESWASEGVVETWGFRTEMVEVLREASIVCLPSYREGLPKSLLEAASCGRAIVTSDTPGCREVVEHEYNGLLVPIRSVEPLADALERLIRDTALCETMGARGRARVLERYDERIIVQATMGVYAELLGDRA